MEKISAVSERDITDELWEKGTKILLYAAYFVSGFILSGAGLLSISAPLSVGLAAACSGRELIFSVAGGVLGGVLRLSGGEAINSVLPLVGTCGTVLVLERLDLKRRRRAVLGATVFTLCFACGTAVMFSETPSLHAVVLIVCSSLFRAFSVSFYSGALECIRRRMNLYALDPRALACVTASLCSLLLGASEASVFGFRPARFFGCFVILAASYFFSLSGGSVAGIAVGGCIAVSGTSAALSVCYGACGLLAGFFSKFGRFVCALVFSVVAGIAALIDGSSEGVAVFAEAAAASIVFAAMPNVRFSRLRSDFLDPRAKRTESEFCAAGERLFETAKAIGSVSDCVYSVSKGVAAMAPAQDEMILMRVRESVCAGCPLKDSFCPETGEFADIIKKLSDGGTVSVKDFSVNFNSKCPSVPRLADRFNKVFASRDVINLLQADAARTRALACAQFDWTARLLRELAEETSSGARVLFNNEKTAFRILSEQGFEPISVNCVQPVSGAATLKCLVEDVPPYTSLSRLAAALSGELGAELSPPEIRERREGKELLFVRREAYRVRLGSARASRGNQKLCGDYFECFSVDSKAYIILSDGMGTGGRAAIDSAMTVEIFSRLVRSGVSLDSALNATNSALSVKSDDESLSTLDVARIDLFDGRALLLKAGAAASFYSRSGRVSQVELPSAPLGVLGSVKFVRYPLKLKGGDVLVMVSDGALGRGSGWLKDEIKTFSPSSDADEFCESVLASARRRCGENFDDTTVITAVVEEI